MQRAPQSDSSVYNCDEFIADVTDNTTKWTRIVAVDNERTQRKLQSRGNAKASVLLFAHAGGEIVMAVMCFKSPKVVAHDDDALVYVPDVSLPADMLADLSKRYPNAQQKKPQVLFCASESGLFDRKLFELVSCDRCVITFFFFFVLLFRLLLWVAFVYISSQSLRKFVLLLKVSHNHNVRTHLVLDNCRIHDSLRLAIEMLASNLVLWYLPKNTSHFSQPLDWYVIATIKNTHRSKVREYLEASGRSGVPLDKSATLGFILESICSISTQRSVRPSFLKTCIVGGFMDPDKAYELFAQRATGKMTDGKRKRRISAPKAAFIQNVLAHVSTTIDGVRQNDGAKVLELNDRLVRVKPLRQGTIVNALQVAEGAIEHTVDSIEREIVTLESKTAKARISLQEEMQRCRTCGKKKTAAAIEAKWVHCECGECVWHATPHCDTGARAQHCGPDAKPMPESRKIQALKVALSLAAEEAAKLKIEKERLMAIAHKPSGKRTQATEKARISKLTKPRGIIALLGSFDQHADPLRLRQELIAADVDVPCTATELLEKTKEVKAKPKKRKQKSDDDDDDDDDKLPPKRKRGPAAAGDDKQDGDESESNEAEQESVDDQQQLGDDDGDD